MYALKKEDYLIRLFNIFFYSERKEVIDKSFLFVGRFASHYRSDD